ncbi:MAG TPA: immunoglobulin domain-containing protein, partial [Ktedonobacteraceae bacterium]|nr:immunoglobulin domain-containing protein [Ktedonobacteraceae bacterium]
MVEALFTKYPVTLTNTNDYIQYQVTFTAQAAMLDYAASGLLVGLYNASQVQPLPGGQNTTAGVAGYAQNWVGYASRIMSSGTTYGVFTRPAQTSASGTSNQDVTYAYPTTGSVVGSGTGTSTISALVANQQYTIYFTITKTGAASLQFDTKVYSGADSTGTSLFSVTTNSTTISTASYDALAFGFRATGASGATHQELVTVNKILVSTNAPVIIVPVITTQPLTQTASAGSSVTLTAVADGGAGTSLTYQWYKDNNPISGATSSSYTIGSAAAGDAGNYYIVVTDTAGSVQSATAALTVSSGAVAPSILTNPTGATILVGGTNTFLVSATGTAPLTYQWKKSSDGT